MESKKISMITIEEASDMCGLSYYVIRRFLIRNQFTGYIKTGSKYLINQELFEAFLRGEMNKPLLSANSSKIEIR